MRLLSWNVNGIRAVYKKGALEWLWLDSADVICLQETKATPDQLPSDLQAPKGYHAYYNSSRLKKGYSGTAIFSKIEPLSISYDIPTSIAKKYDLADSYGDPNAEGRVVALEYKDFFVCNVYTPNSKDDLSRIPLRHNAWDPAFLEYIKQLEKKKPVILCGDLNVAHSEDDLARPKENVGKKGFTAEERQGIDNMITKGLVDTFRLFTKGNGHYTWWSHFAAARDRNIGWRIDYFFVSKILVPKITKAEILADVMGSDHCPVLIEIK